MAQIVTSGNRRASTAKPCTSVRFRPGPPVPRILEPRQTSLARRSARRRATWFRVPNRSARVRPWALYQISMIITHFTAVSSPLARRGWRRGVGHHKAPAPCTRRGGEGARDRGEMGDYHRDLVLVAVLARSVRQGHGSYRGTTGFSSSTASAVRIGPAPGQDGDGANHEGLEPICGHEWRGQSATQPERRVRWHPRPKAPRPAMSARRTSRSPFRVPMVLLSNSSSSTSSGKGNITARRCLWCSQ